MDSQNKLKVLKSKEITDYGIVVELENVQNEILKKGVLKSINSNLFWEVQERIIDTIFDENNIVENYQSDEEILKQKEERNIHLYTIKSIGNNEKPIVGENLVFHSTTFRKKIQIIKICDDYFLLEDETGYKAVIPKRKVPSKAKIGDYVRHCEHQFHDLVDENDNFVYR